MANPFRPGNVYYADVPEGEVRERETRNNPERGPRPWIVLYSREHKHTGVVIAAPLHSRAVGDRPSIVACTSEDFDGEIVQSGFILLEQLRALDKSRLKLDRGPVATMKRMPFNALRGALMGMFDPRLLPSP